MRKGEFYRDATRERPGPLAGVRVADVTTTWAGPMCGCVLADFGADVIKVESPEGEVARRLPPMLPGAESFAHETVNRNKRALTLDLREDAGREVFRKLVAESDVVVENFRAGTFDRWGIGYRDLCAVKRDIVFVSITGWGQFGPDCDRAGYDPLAQSASGFMSLNGTAAGDSVKAPTFLGDDLAGLHGALGALAALRHRDQTGEGQHVDVSLLDALLFQSNGYLTLGALGVPIERMGNEYIFASPANVYACADGAVYLGVVLDTHWQRLVQVLERPDLREKFATGPLRVQGRDELNRLVAAWCEARTIAEVGERILGAGLPFARVQSYEDAARDPHVLAREMLQDVELSGGRALPLTGPAIKFSRTPTRIRSRAPALGADDDTILSELGLSTEEVERLRAAGIVRRP